MRWPHLSRRTQLRSRRRLRFEPLEGRRLMACLAVGVTLDVPGAASNGTCDAADQTTPILVGKVGQQFTLQIKVQDVRNAGQTPAGVIALPVDVSWDKEDITFLTPPMTMDRPVPIPLPPPTEPPPFTELVTSSFTLQRFLQDFDANANPTLDEFNLQGLRGAALPNFGEGAAIGIGGEQEFSKLNFQAMRATIAPHESLFTIRLAGSMSFADASVLEKVVPGSNTVRVDDITVQARLQIDPVIISGMKFNDLNGDGVKDGNELGLSGWTIRLIRDENLNNLLDAGDTEITTATTAADGSYQLAVNDAGTYFVREVQQEDWVQTTQDPAPITTSGVDVAGVDFGNNFPDTPPPATRTNSLSGFVFADTNLNGKFDVGEDGLPNVTVRLQRTDIGNTPAVTALTGPDGWYHFEEVASGVYDVIEIQPAGFANASITQGLVFPDGSSQPAASLRGTTDGFNAFRGINLSGGGNAVDFNFGDNVIPTKRRFVASVDPFAETCSALGLKCVTVRGTTGNDQIDFAPDTEVVRVTVNNLPAQEFSRATVNIVKIDALAGEDTVTLSGGSADDVAHFQPNACTIQIGGYRPGDYAVVAVNAERTIANGGLGNDLAVFSDSAVDDVLTATNEPFIGPVTEFESMLDMRRFVRAVAFERTRAVSIPRDGIDDTDIATLNGLPIELVGKWQTTALP